MADKKLIYVKFEYVESLEMKKDILNMQKDLADMGETMRNFNSLRSRELKTKVRIYAKIKGILFSMKKLKKELPEYRIPKIFNEKIIEEKNFPVMPAKKFSGDGNIEAQLREIQEKLNSIHRNN
jgi:hypothetical protein